MNVSQKYFSIPCLILKKIRHTVHTNPWTKKHVFNYKQLRQLSIPTYVQDFKTVNIVHVHEIVTGATSFFIQLCTILSSMYIN